MISLCCPPLPSPQPFAALILTMWNQRLSLIVAALYYSFFFFQLPCSIIFFLNLRWRTLGSGGDESLSVSNTTYMKAGERGEESCGARVGEVVGLPLVCGCRTPLDLWKFCRSHETLDEFAVPATFYFFITWLPAKVAEDPKYVSDSVIIINNWRLTTFHVVHHLKSLITQNNIVTNDHRWLWPFQYFCFNFNLNASRIIPDKVVRRGMAFSQIVLETEGTQEIQPWGVKHSTRRQTSKRASVPRLEAARRWGQCGEPFSSAMG